MYAGEMSVGFVLAILIGAVLNTILFFKIWGMTNRIKTMDSTMSDVLAYTKNLQKNVLTICKIAEESTGINFDNASPDPPTQTEPPKGEQAEDE